MGRSTQLDGKTVTLYRATDARRVDGAIPPTVLSADFGGSGASMLERCRSLGCPEFNLVTVCGLDWNSELSPWPAGPATKGGDSFGGGAPGYLAWLTGHVLPHIESELGGDAPVFLAGYSMAGLFALWALYQTDRFAGAACISGSLWFPGFAEYAESHGFAGNPRGVYLSLGSKESGGRNPLFSQNESICRRLATHYQTHGVPATFELNPGNHFADPGLRVAKGVTWLLGGR